ncbi:MAG: DUF3352 domain-containing protein, partial [Cyclobacteriaceae bacterium]|nr:DUF3352 domain-containing protein [Cyclobacteriaceae bacterium]
MKRNAIFATLATFAVIAGGIWGYDYYFNKEDWTIWSLVPENSALVYEPEGGSGPWNNFLNSKIGQSLDHIPAFARMHQDLIGLDSLLGTEVLEKLTSGGHLLITATPVSGSSFDYLFIIDAGKSNTGASVVRALDKLIKENNLQVNKRVYNGMTISEVKFEDQLFSFSDREGFWFGSYTPFLVEDVVRQFTEKEGIGFAEVNPELYRNSKIKNDFGNIYFNFNQLSLLLNTFLAPGLRSTDSPLAKTGKSAFYDISIDDELIMLNGFSFYSGPDQYLSNLSQTPPTSSNIEMYLPSGTAFVYHYLTNSTTENEAFNATLHGEMAHVIMEATTIAKADQLLLFRSKRADKSLAFLDELARTIADDNPGDTVYYEHYSDFVITELKKEALNVFPENSSWDTYYYTRINDLIAMGNTLQAVKDFVLDIETENTWGKSVKNRKFLENLLGEANFNFYFDLNKGWDLITSQLHDDWKAFLSDNQVSFRNFNLGAIQYSYTDNNFYSNVSLSFQAESANLFTERKRLAADLSIALSARAITKPKVVRNHLDQSREVIIQSEDKRLVLISSEGNIMWADSLDGEVQGEIMQIDYYRNGKLQYFLCSDSSIYIIDRLGNTLEGYPKKLPFKVDQVAVIDYDNSKRYRFLISDVRGNLFMYDIEGKNLEGWQPVALDGRLAAPPRHVRVRGRDFIIAVQENGQVNLLTRRGERVEGFPVDMGNQLTPVYALENLSDFENSYLVFITTDGLLTKLNFKGEIKYSQQLFRA